MAENQFHFEKLTPTDEVKLGVYKNAFDFVFANDDLRNIAISGAYSSGKSSVLASYKKYNKNIKFLHISLAHFQSMDNDSTNHPDENDNTSAEYMTESVLEGKILNQLLHQIDPENIPQTNFRIKKERNLKKIVCRVGVTCVLSLTLAHQIFYSTWNSYVDWLGDTRLAKLLSFSVAPESLLVSGILSAAILAGLAWYFFRLQSDKSIVRKLDIKGNTIELFSESKDSYFDKYLNEVLYLFDNAGADVIVFEDIDRFETSQIFERLHEVNCLVNVKREKTNKKPIRFFYLLRDDIFVNKDRTKFFDFIIPVVPVIDGSNAYDQFITVFQKSGLYEQFDEHFLENLSLYIDDMRLLENIYNEFLIYYSRINNTELDANKMLAMIAYKNVFPKDFADLQIYRGFVYYLFQSKPQIMSSRETTIRKAIESIEDRIEKAKSATHFSKREVDEYYAYKYSGYSENSWVRRNDNELEEWISSRISQQENSQRLERKKAVEDSNNIDILLSQQHDYEIELDKLRQEKLCRLITRENVSEIFNSITGTDENGEDKDYLEIKSSTYFGLLKYLIRNEYIDEQYSDYMTYFYEQSISRNDKIFLLSVTDQQAKGFDYPLDDSVKVLTRLRLPDFTQPETLNFALLDSLLTEKEYEDCLIELLKQIHDTENYTFVLQYTKRKKFISEFVQYLNREWPDMFHQAMAKRKFSETELHQYSIWTLCYSEDEIIDAVNKDNLLCDYISHKEDYLNIENPQIEELIRQFNRLQVCFDNISENDCDESLLEEVYKASLYSISYRHIQMMLQRFYSINEEWPIKHQNYSVIMQSPESPLAEYIVANIEEYMQVMLACCEGNIEDFEDYVIEILNNDNISDTSKKRYIECLITSISSLESIKSKSLWPFLLDKCIVVYNAENIMKYFLQSKSIDKYLLDFINSNERILSFSDLSSDFTEKDKEQLYDIVLKTNEMSDVKYREVLMSLGFYPPEFTVSGLSEEKVTILIDEELIRMDMATLEFIRENYPNNLYDFIRKDISGYVEIMDADHFSMDELKVILKWSVDESLKLKLLEVTRDSISIIGEHYSVDLKVYILKNNFDESDWKSLCNTYDELETEIKQFVFERACSNIRKVIAIVDNVCLSLIRELLENSRIDEKDRDMLFIKVLPSICTDEEKVRDYLNILGLNEITRTLDGKRARMVADNQRNVSVLEALGDCNIIYKFEHKDNDSIWVTKQPPKQHGNKIAKRG